MQPKPPLKKRVNPGEPSTVSEKTNWRAVALYGALGGQIVAVFLACLWTGAYLDKKMDTDSIFLLLGSFVGMVIGGYQVYRLIQFEKKNRKS